MSVDSSGNITSSKSCGSYLVGVSFGVSDAANLVSTDLRTAFTIGNNPSVTFAGEVTIPANATNAYANGSINTQYEFWEEDVSATMNTSVMVPPGDGSVVTLNSGAVNFDLFGATESWRVRATNMTGTVWNTLNLDGGITIAGELDPFDFGGRVDATLSYLADHSFEFPSGFDPSSCEAADNSDTFPGGFGVKGDFEVDVSATVSNLRVSSSDEITGSVGVNLNTDGTLKVKWPCWFTCGYECVDEYDVNVAGNLDIEKTSSSTRLHGSVTVSNGSESESADLDIDISAI